MSADDKARAEHSRHAEKISKREAAKRTAEMKDRIEEVKAQRLVEAQLKNTKALGAVENARDDDLLVQSSSVFLVQILLMFVCLWCLMQLFPIWFVCGACAHPTNA